MTGFHPLLPTVLTLTVLIIGMALLVWQEWKRPARFRTVRIIAVMTMLSSLAAIILRPTYRTETSSEILLLTSGYPSHVVDSLLKSNPDLQIKHIPNTRPYKSSIGLNSLNDLPGIQDEIRYIAGQGLPPYALDLLTNSAFNFFPGEIPSGITSLFLPDNIQQHHLQQISGTMQNTSGKKRIYLKNPGGKEDSLVINGVGNYPFELSFTPRQDGDLLYSIVIDDSLGNTISETIPIHVESPKPLTIFFIQGYPTFETQYLKTFLSEKHHKLALRYEVSKQLFRYEYANRSAIPLSRLTKSTLDEFDLLIVDDDAFKKLTTSEKTAVMASVNDGLGVLTLNATKSNGPFPKLVPVKTDTTVLHIGSSTFTLPAAPVRAVITSGVQAVTQNASGILSGYTYAGRGKTGFQFLKETYRLALAGDSISYSALWTPLIEQVSKQNVTATSIKIKSQFPYYADEPILIDLISSSENPELYADSVQLPLLEGVLIDDLWHTTLWADATGWHTLHTKDDAHLSYYSSPVNAWQTLSIRNQMRGTALHKREGLPSTEVKANKETEIPSLYFFFAFLMSAGFLWLAPKL